MERNMILFLDKMPDKAAELYRDSELPRAVMNVHNILCRPDLLDDVVLKQHLWTYESIANYSWVVVHADALALRYTKSGHGNWAEEILDRIAKVYRSPVPLRVSGTEFTDVPLCVPDKFRAVTFENPPPQTEEDARYHRELEIDYLDYAPLSQAVEIYLDYQELMERKWMAGVIHD